ncbi:MAG: FAD-dependent oxidoreductase [PVC group bacterium]
MSEKPICVLGGGLSALSFAYFSRRKIVVYEKEDRLGGLCRSFETGGVRHDIGPHIFFSKDRETLDFLLSLTPMHQLRRSNKIFYRGKFVKYPFENELSALPDEDRDWCLETFINNPYRDYPAPDMLSFFYKTFGEGITRAYLEPYNRKIWKFEPAFMDTQMVGRIPNPPPEDIIASARGVPTEGYLHQLYFSYPDRGGTESIIRALAERCRDHLEVHLSSPLESLGVNGDGTFRVSAGGRARDFGRVVSTLPLHELFPRLEPAPPVEVARALGNLKYNSLHVVIVQTARDNLGDNLAVMVPQPDISFHRVTRLDFLGENYRLPGVSTLMAEITFRPGDRFDLPPEAVAEMAVRDLDRLGFCPAASVKSASARTFRYAYVIYDLDHRENTDRVLAWLRSRGIVSLGRFAAFEYINMNDAVGMARDCAARFA